MKKVALLINIYYRWRSNLGQEVGGLKQKKLPVGKIRTRSEGLTEVISFRRIS
jgi:hypothetical protein